MSMTEALTVVGAANAIVLFVCCGAMGPLGWRWSDVMGGASWESAVAVMVAALTVWLLRTMDPIRFSTRFLVIPLVTIFEGAVLLRPEITGRMAVGFLLLAGGSLWMLGAKQVEEKVLTLR
jgi:drug/metabolite transporter (DMT)-like permease